MDDIQELYFLFPELKDHIEVEKKVGQGTFSYVYLAHFCQKEKEKLALKYIIPTSSPSRTKQEVECLLNIGGQDNVIGVLSVLRNKSHILILMPYVDHTAFHDSFIYWNLKECKEYIKNLMIALNRVHQCGIIHRDVKPSNFLYDKHTNKFALVDFGLAQTYDKTTENIFEYGSSNSKKSIGKIENTPTKRNFITLNKKGLKQNAANSPSKTPSSHLVLTNQKKLNSIVNQGITEANSMPHTPPSKDEKKGIPNSISFDSELNKKDEKTKTLDSSSPYTANTPTTENHKNSTNVLNKPYLTSNLQKYYSFQKSSYNFSENKCTCFNMPFVCEICTTRTGKWAPRAGTAGFRAPEVLFRSTHQTPSVDIWSAGIIFLSILTGRYPFFKAVDDNMAIMQLISLFGAEPVRKAATKYGESLVCSFDKNKMSLKELCIGLRKGVIKSTNTNLNKAKFQNNSTELIVEFPDSAYDLLKKLLELDCEKRFSAEEALKHSFFHED